MKEDPESSFQQDLHGYYRGPPPIRSAFLRTGWPDCAGEPGRGAPGLRPATPATPPQKLLDPSAVGLNHAWVQPANFAGGFVLIEELHVARCAAQELLGHFAPSNSTHPIGPMWIDLQTPSGTLDAFDSEKHKLA
jgi:hypothetical protein